MISQASFLYTDITNVTFRNVKWKQIKDNKRSTLSLGGYKLYDAVLYEESLKDENKNHGSLDDVLSVYRMLRDNYEAKANYKEAGRFFIGEMELRRKHAKGIEKFILSFYRLSDYGEDVSKPVIILAIIPIISAIISTIFGDSKEDLWQILSDFGMNFVEKLSLMIQSGIDGEKPIDKIINPIQRIISIPLLVMFGLALRRNFERKVRK